MKKLIIYISISFIININLYSKNIYEKNCLSCHNSYPVKIDKLFFRYLLFYGSEKNVKKALFDYLKEPKLEKSVMYEEFINRFGIKQPTKLKEKELKKAIDIFWEENKVFGKLK